MERCLGIDKMSVQEENVLKQKMVLLHSFNMVHMDIKPINLGVSSRTLEPVMFDFGLCEYIKEGIGNSTVTYFGGTTGYFGQEMAAAFK